MKKNNVFLLASLIVSIFLSVGLESTYASNTNAKGKNTNSHMGYMKNGSGAEMQKFGTGAGNPRYASGSEMREKGENHSEMLANVATGSLSSQEEQDLYYQYREEMLARDMYNYFYSLYSEETFKNIASSEQQHMDAVKSLLDRYNLTVPSGYGELQDEFDSLKDKGNDSLKDALEVGLKIEMLDIEDIVDSLKTTDNDDIKLILSNIGGASYNHLRGFALALTKNSLTTSIDYSAYLDTSDTDNKGNIKDKLMERLDAEGITLPAKVGAKNGAYGDMQNDNNSGKTNTGNNTNKNSQNKKDKYKTSIKSKYGKSIEKLNDSSKGKILNKVNSAIDKVENSSTYSDAEKQNYLSIYEALKEYIEELLN
ncbi:DUF2202 domain-containing protein [Candidatus Gracilibacteria bacterium]|nr:DUF2202 domain-containing protein [Candidatus Gracilibacteria bacterium]NUJ98555.1 DUF2202 domain-containing protein [Candidatus Gracilibacteria bacterium]